MRGSIDPSDNLFPIPHTTNSFAIAGSPKATMIRVRSHQQLSSILSLDDFMWNGPTGKIATTHDPKCVFMKHLGLNENDAFHQEIFSMMKCEATLGRDRLDRRPPAEVFLPDALDIHGMRPTTGELGVHDIREDAFAATIREVYHSASPQTRCMYDIVGNPSDDNWIIRWMLWHVIQGRLSPAPGPGVLASPPLTDSPTLIKLEDEGDIGSPFSTGRSGSRDSFYDPVRNR